MWRGRAFAAVLVLCACVTTKDSVGGGDQRLDDDTRPDKPEAPAKVKAECGPDGKGDVVLLDARTAGPLTCTQVSLSAEQSSCAIGTECPSDPVFQGRTNARGQIAIKQAFSGVRLVAVADGYSPSYLENATLQGDKVLELEMAPADGFWLKVLDADGNYLQDLQVSFKQGSEVIAQLRTNDLANVFFASRTPFSGQAVTVEASGFQAKTINSVADLGADGHTLTLSR
jgi:hypothetical protein